MSSHLWGPWVQGGGHDSEEQQDQLADRVDGSVVARHLHRAGIPAAHVPAAVLPPQEDTVRGECRKREKGDGGGERRKGVERGENGGGERSTGEGRRGEERGGDEWMLTETIGVHISASVIHMYWLLHTFNPAARFRHKSNM